MPGLNGDLEIYAPDLIRQLSEPKRKIKRLHTLSVKPQKL